MPTFAEERAELARQARERAAEGRHGVQHQVQLPGAQEGSSERARNALLEQQQALVALLRQKMPHVTQLRAFVRSGTLPSARQALVVAEAEVAEIENRLRAIALQL